MSNTFSRIEGTVPDTVRDWVDLESLRTSTPVKIIVGNAISLYKSQNEGTNLGERIELMDICEKKCKKNLQNLRQNVSNFGKIEPKIAQYTYSLMKLLNFLTKKTPKKSHDSIRSLYRGAIADHIEAISGIEHTDQEVYLYCIDLMNKNIDKAYLEYFTALTKNSRGLEGTYNKNKDITYIGGTLDNDTIYNEISELAGNCMTTPKKYRVDKIESVKEHISNTYEQNEITNLISMFMCEIEKLEAKK